jgi:hypothetical protein
VEADARDATDNAEKKLKALTILIVNGSSFLLKNQEVLNLKKNERNIYIKKKN